MTIALVCPGCRTRTPERLDLRTIEPAGDGTLACECGRRYPIIDGVPLVLTDPSAASTLELLEPAAAAALALPGPDEAPHARQLEHLSIYLDAHYGDRATPRPDGPGGGHAHALLHALGESTRTRVGTAVELGCSVGRFASQLAATADHVIALDLSHAALRRARRILAGEALAYSRRTVGRHYEPAHIARATPITNVTLVCGDALDPPLVPAVFDRVVALNLFDAVSNPRQLLSVVDALCAPGGELILASPYAWQSSVLPDAHRFGDADPAGALVATLQAGRGLGARYAVEEAVDLPWTLRRDARSAVTYCIHYIRARQV